MSDFLDTLTVYYFCDAMVALRRLNPAEIAGCMDSYEAVKRHFVEARLAPTGTPERIEQMRRAYLNFLAWQNANAVFVADLRAAAEARALALVPGLR
jgi:hypothetical protein